MATPSVTPNTNGNPFNQPLNSELQESQQRQAATVAASPNGNPFDEPLASEKADATLTHPSGEITNDVGNTVIVPKDGESFSDTMKRAAAQGQKTTPDQINREVATMPGKTAETLGAAATIGAGGAALIGTAGSPSALGATESGLLDNVGEPVVKAAVDHLANLTKIVQAAKNLGWASFGLKEAHDIYKMVSGDKK
jgi:hypothetical protein